MSHNFYSMVLNVTLQTNVKPSGNFICRLSIIPLMVTLIMVDTHDRTKCQVLSVAC